MQMCDRCGRLEADLIRAEAPRTTPSMVGWKALRISVRAGVVKIAVFLCLECFDPFPPETFLEVSV